MIKVNTRDAPIIWPGSPNHLNHLHWAELKMDSLKKPREAKWKKLKPYSPQSQPQTKSLSMSKGSKLLQEKWKRWEKERKRVDVLLAAEFTVVRGLDTHVIDINAIIFLFVIISELFFFDSTHWIYQ